MAVSTGLVDAPLLPPLLLHGSTVHPCHLALAILTMGDFSQRDMPVSTIKALPFGSA